MYKHELWVLPGTLVTNRTYFGHFKLLILIAMSPLNKWNYSNESDVSGRQILIPALNPKTHNIGFHMKRANIFETFMMISN